MSVPFRASDYRAFGSANLHDFPKVSFFYIIKKMCCTIQNDDLRVSMSVWGASFKENINPR